MDPILREEIMNSTSNEMLADRRVDFEGVAARYSPVLFRIAFRRLRNIQDAEDAVQDAFLSAYKHIGQFEGRSQLSSWLTRIVINAAAMKLRSRPRQEAVPLDQVPEGGRITPANELVDAGPTPETICAQSEMAGMLHRALAHLSPGQRAALEMRELAGLSSRETAEALQITSSALKSRVSRARQAVGSYLGEFCGIPRAAAKPEAAAANPTPDSRRRRTVRRHVRRFTSPGRVSRSSVSLLR